MILRWMREVKIFGLLRKEVCKLFLTMALRFSIWLLFKIRNFSFRIIDWWEIELEPGLHWRCQIKMRRNFRWCANRVLVWSKNNLLDHLKILLKRSVKMIWRNLWKGLYRKRRSSNRNFHLGWNTFLKRERSFQHLNNDWYYSFLEYESSRLVWISHYFGKIAEIEFDSVFQIVFFQKFLESLCLCFCQSLSEIH